MSHLSQRIGPFPTSNSLVPWHPLTSHSDPHRVKHSWKSSSTSNHGVLGQQIAILLRFPSVFFRRFESVWATGEKGERWTVEKKCTSLYEFVKSKKKRPIDTAQRLVEQQSQIKRDHENTETVVSKKTITQLASALVQAPITKTHYRKLSHMSQAKPNKKSHQCEVIQW